ncbi:MAG: hypothetical protein KDB00_12120, partial [Planctomycetales bacterium]|nr:hypothetical protein [Planctomycetales bacterium]
AGFVAAGVLRGDHPIVHAESLVTPSDRAVYLLDVRTESEFAAGHLPGATNIPVEDLRDRLDEIPRGQRVIAYCKVGQRGYLATRILMQNGFDVANMSGGYVTWCRIRSTIPNVSEDRQHLQYTGRG